jgi:hypothetical protein
MRLTKQQLKQIIKEELENLDEIFDSNFFGPKLKKVAGDIAGKLGKTLKSSAGPANKSYSEIKQLLFDTFKNQSKNQEIMVAMIDDLEKVLETMKNFQVKHAAGSGADEGGAIPGGIGPSAAGMKVDPEL